MSETVAIKLGFGDDDESPENFFYFGALERFCGTEGYARGSGRKRPIFDPPTATELKSFSTAAATALDALREIADESPAERSKTAEERLQRVREIAERAFFEIERELSSRVRRLSV